MRAVRIYILSVLFAACAAGSACFAQEQDEQAFDSPDQDVASGEAVEVPALAPASAQQPVAEITKSAPGTISLDVKGMDVVDVFKMLSNRFGINIVIGKNVSGKVTLFLKDVQLWDAFELIIVSNNLAYEKKGGIINVMTQEDYEQSHGSRFGVPQKAKVIALRYAKATDIANGLNQMKTPSGKVIANDTANTLVLIDSPEVVAQMETYALNSDVPVETRVFALNYAQAEKINPKVLELLTKNIGSTRVDERTNKMFVTDFPQKLDEITPFIRAMDERTPQVVIDAQIVEIQPSDEFAMGVDWDFWIKKHFRITAPILASTGLPQMIVGASNAPAEEGEYKTIIDLLQTIGDTKILSSPRILAVNNQEAKILVGKKDAYITSATSQSGTTDVTAQTVNFVETGIKLFVTPTINRDGFVTMKIRPEVSSAETKDITSEGKVTQVPIVTTSETETTVMIKDGVTVIIGGLRKHQKINTVKKVPILGDIPFLGRAFKSEANEDSRNELVILLTPHIFVGDVALTDFGPLKPKDGALVDLYQNEILVEEFRKENGGGSFKSKDEYFAFVTNKIKAMIEFGEIKQKGAVGVAFTLNADGTLRGDPEVYSSTDPSLEELAVKLVRKAGPFPSFPGDLMKEKENFRVVLDFNPQLSSTAVTK